MVKQFTYFCSRNIKVSTMRIKELIKQKGLTQKEFAEKLGMTTVGLSQILAGKPSYTTMEKIASTLGVEVWELLVSPEEIIKSCSVNSGTITCPKCGNVIHVEVRVK